MTDEKIKHVLHQHIALHHLQKEIAAEMQCSESTVNSICLGKYPYNKPEILQYRQELLDQYGKPRYARLYRMTENELRSILCLYQQGTSMNELVAEYGLQHHHLRDLLDGRIFPHLQEYRRELESRYGTRTLRNKSGENNPSHKFS